MNQSFNYPELNEQLVKIKHKSGLDIFVVPKKGYSKTYAVFATKYGSIDRCFKTSKENDFLCVPDGIAHFLEHKLFEGKDGNAFEKYAKTGASANAYTSFDKTAYLFSCTDNFKESLEILLEFVQNPYFTDENVEKEQGIIGQEIRMYDDDPGFRVFFNLLNSLYINHGAKVDIAGTVESISKINKDILYACYNTFYNLNNMVLCVVGNVSPEEVIEVADKTIGQSKKIEIEVKNYDEPKKILKKYSEQKLAVSMPLFHIGFKDNDNVFEGRESLKNDFVTQILLEMIAGPHTDVYSELYDSGLINRGFAAEYMLCRSFAVSLFAGESKDPKAVLDKILLSIENLKKSFDEDSYEKSKKVVYSRMIRQFNSTDGIANSMISCYFNNTNIFDGVDVFKEITKEDAKNRLTSHFSDEFCSLSVISAL